MLKLNVYDLNHILDVSTPNQKIYTSLLKTSTLPISYDNRDLQSHFVILDIDDFNMIMGMYYLDKYHVLLDCHHKRVIISIPKSDPLIITRRKGGRMNVIISTTKGKALIQKGCRAFAAIISIVESRVKGMGNMEVVRYFLDVFLDDMPN